MTFQIKNETGSAITFAGTSYAVNDYVPIYSHIFTEGLSFTRNDLDGPNAGRALDGTLIRDRVAIKDKWEVTMEPLVFDDMVAIFKLIEPEWITVQYTSPRTGATVTKTMYSNNVPASYLIKKGSVEYWSGITFPLVEK